MFIYVLSCCIGLIPLDIQLGRSKEYSIYSRSPETGSPSPKLDLLQPLQEGGFNICPYSPDSTRAMAQKDRRTETHPELEERQAMSFKLERRNDYRTDSYRPARPAKQAVILDLVRNQIAHEMDGLQSNATIETP